MCLAFVVVAPVSWRVLFPERIDLRHGGVRLILYGAIGAGVVLSLGVVVPRVLGMGDTLLTAPSSVVVSWRCSSWAGWGSGRDIWLENQLAARRGARDALAREAERAQLLALRAHLDPHFLFNTLNAIAEWCREDGEIAERAVMQLSAMLRTVLAGVRAPTWPLRRGARAAATRCSSCTGLRDPDRVRVDAAAAGAAARASACRRCCCCRWPRTRSSTGRPPGTRARSCSAPRSPPTDERLRSCRSRTRARIAGGAPGGSGIEMVERRLALAYDGRAALPHRRRRRRHHSAEVTLPLGAASAGAPA